MPDSRSTAVRRVIGLRRFPLFATADLDEVATIAENVVERSFPSGTILAAAGARPSTLQLILEGRVESPSLSRVWEAPHVVGALEVFATQPIAYTCVAATDVRTLQLSATDVGEILEDNFGVLLGVVRELSSRLIASATRPATIPHALPGDNFGLVERLLALRQQLPFAEARLQALTSLAKASEDVRWPSGSLVISPEDRELFGVIVIEGELAVDGRAEPVGPGGSIGMLEAIAGQAHRRHVHARSAVRALRSSAAAILDVIEDHTDVGLAMISSFASALLPLPRLPPH